MSMTKYDAINLLNELDDSDPELAHCKADDILVEFLIDNGFQNVAEAFVRAQDRVGFWYA